MHAAAPADAVLEAHEADVAGAVLVHGHGLRGTRVGPRRGAGAAGEEGVPVAQRQVVEPAGGDLLIREEDVVALHAAGDEAGAVDHAHLPAAAVVGRARRSPRSGLCGCPLGGEDAAVDDQVQVAQDDVRALRREDRQQLTGRAAVPAMAGRSKVR